MALQKESQHQKDSFFTQPQLSIFTWIKPFYLWASDKPVTKVRSHLDDGECSTTTAVDAYEHISDVCTGKLHSSPILLGVPDTVVEIDESVMRHNRKVCIGKGCFSHVGSINCPLTILFFRFDVVQFRTSTAWSTLDLRYGRHVLVPSSWLYLGGRQARRRNVIANYPGAHLTQHHHTYRPVRCLQRPNHDLPHSCRSQDSQSQQQLSPPHKQYRKLLEPNKKHKSCMESQTTCYPAIKETGPMHDHQYYSKLSGVAFKNAVPMDSRWRHRCLVEDGCIHSRTWYPFKKTGPMPSRRYMHTFKNAVPIEDDGTDH